MQGVVDKAARVPVNGWSFDGPTIEIEVEP
jgi:hypothetical protein